MREVDVVVVGAGPAGTAAAIGARRAGLTVAVIDKARFPREKICGDGLTTTCLRLLDELGLDPRTVASWHQVDDVAISSPSRRQIVFPLPREMGQFAVIAERRDLDAALVDLARSTGAEIHEGHGIATIEQGTERVSVTTDGGLELSGRHVVAADGMWSPTRKLLGLETGRYLGEWHAFRQYFRNVHAQPANRLHVWFEPDLLPGYVWSFPLPEGRANLGFGILRDGSIPTRDMTRIWGDIVERPHIRSVIGPDAEPEEPHRGWPIPARVGDLPLTLGRTLFVGDAAAATDPMTGEGIAQALFTGLAAARSIARFSSPEQVRRLYERHVHDELAIDHRLARALGATLRSPRGARGAVRVAGLSPWTRRHFARWLFEDYPRAVVATPSRWRRDLFRRPGAYASAGKS